MKIGITLFTASILWTLAAYAYLFRANQDSMQLYPQDDFVVLPVKQNSNSDRHRSRPEKAFEIWRLSESGGNGDVKGFGRRLSDGDAIEFNHARSADVVAGDLVIITLPDKSRYTAIVDYVSVNEEGETSWSGYLEGLTTGYPVIFSIGTTSSFATIATPKGFYAMEAFEDIGWLYKTRDIIEAAEEIKPEQLASD